MTTAIERTGPVVSESIVGLLVPNIITTPTDKFTITTAAMNADTISPRQNSALIRFDLRAAPISLDAVRPWPRKTVRSFMAYR